ncbi:MAG: hypothetical protein ACREH6_12375 [Geminicoccaceae bacterium]
MARWCLILTLVIALRVDEVLADPLARPSELDAFGQFVTATEPVCRSRPAEECIRLAFRFADTDGDLKLSAAELYRVRDDLEAWTEQQPDSLAPEQRGVIALGLGLVDAIGLETLMAGYDADGDGSLDRAELLADLRLDQRPLGELILDPAALDRHAMAHRLGVLAPWLDRVLR